MSRAVALPDEIPAIKVRNKLFKVRNKVIKVRNKVFKVRNKLFKVRNKVINVRSKVFKVRNNVFKVKNKVLKVRIKVFKKLLLVEEQLYNRVLSLTIPAALSYFESASLKGFFLLRIRIYDIYLVKYIQLEF